MPDIDHTLTDAQGSDLRKAYTDRARLAHQEGDDIAFRIWNDAADLLSKARESAFKERADARDARWAEQRKSLGLRYTR